MMEPQVLLFDEPTAALTRNYRSNRQHYSASWRKRTLPQVIVTHEVEVARKIAPVV